MTKVYCADRACEFNDDKSLCTKELIGLSFHSVTTRWEGHQDYLRCQMYQKSAESIKIEEMFHGYQRNQCGDPDQCKHD